MMQKQVRSPDQELQDLEGLQPTLGDLPPNLGDPLTNLGDGVWLEVPRDLEALLPVLAFLGDPRVQVADHYAHHHHWVKGDCLRCECHHCQETFLAQAVQLRSNCAVLHPGVLHPASLRRASIPQS